MSLYKWITAKIRSQDRFNREIDLFYKKDSSYKTTWGGFATLVLFIITLIFAVPLLISMVKLSDISILQNTKVIDFTSPEEYNHRIKTSEFTFAVSLGKHALYYWFDKGYLKRLIL